MGFSFRGKTSERPVDVNEADVVSSGSDIQGNPEADLKKFRKLHTFDPFLDIDKLEAVDNVLATGDIEKEADVEDQLLSEDSPYPEVRAAVSDSQTIDQIFLKPVSSSAHVPVLTRLRCPRRMIWTRLSILYAHGRLGCFFAPVSNL